ncbi:MAG: hypothetical protein JO115_18975 [Pseudonocardiales bacterium]|nr:hypothetical protein [Pseudonocardiales bacterium]
MPLAAIITIIGALLTVLVLAAYLISIALVLWRVDAKLGAITAGLHSVTEKTKPIGPIVEEINRDLAGVDNALRAVLAK